MAASGISASDSGNRAARKTSNGGDKSPAAYRTIGEVAEIVGVPQHVLRFWETRFPQLKPLKRSGNRRYYRPEDVALLQAIRVLLHERGLTIRGVQKRLREEGVRRLVASVLQAEHGRPEGGGDEASSTAVLSETGSDESAPLDRDVAAGMVPACAPAPAAGSQERRQATGRPDLTDIMDRLKRIRALLDVAADER